jgi:hypothetical protein
MKQPRDPLELRILELLDDRSGALDAHSLSRLRQARSRALETAAQGWRPWLLAPAGALAALLVAILAFPRPAPEVAPLSEVALAEIDPTILETDLEVLEDLDFYQWLDTVAAR